MKIKPLNRPLYVTQPLLPKLEVFHEHLKDIWDSKWLSNGGSKHQALEERLNAILEVPYTSLFNNGTTALIIALKALGLTGGEVITTPFTFAATTHAIIWAGLRPVFCDIDKSTLNMDPEQIVRHVTTETVAILPVHVYGIPCDVEKIQQVADKYQLKVVYDAAHAFTVKVNGVGIGNYGDITMFSFHATKLFNTAEGGALTFADHELKVIADRLKNFGITGEEEVSEIGINGKMNELQAAMGLAVLAVVESELQARQKLKDAYIQGIANIPGIQPILKHPKATDSLQYFIIRINKSEYGRSRDQVYSALKGYNILARKYFSPLTCDLNCYKHHGPRAELPTARQVSSEVLALPFHSGVRESDILLICALLKLWQRPNHK